MVDSKTISVLWSYIMAYDDARKPTYLSSAFSMFEGIIESTELPNFEVEAYTIRYYGPYHPKGKGPHIEKVNINNENIKEYIEGWTFTLLRIQGDGHPHLWMILDTAKASLVKILVALNMVANPQEKNESELLFEDFED